MILSSSTNHKETTMNFLASVLVLSLGTYLVGLYLTNEKNPLNWF